MGKIVGNIFTLLTLLAALSIETNPVNAATMSILEYSSYVRLYGRIDSFNDQNQENISALYNKELRGGDSFDGQLKLGMSIELPEGNGYGQGQAYQTLVVKDDQFNYGGLADVNISGYSSYPNRVEGYGAALVETSIHLQLSGQNNLSVLVESSVGDFMDDDFKVVLSKDGKAIWSRVGGSDRKLLSRSAPEVLLLDSGGYVMTVSLKAASYLSGSTSMAGRSASNFSVSAISAISAVPELPALQQGIVGAFSIIVATAYIRLRRSKSASRGKSTGPQMSGF